jgi:uncharacterized protein (DUF1810 family)
MSSSFNIDRFLQAQETSYAAARSELQSGRKRSHWMWYMFPQVIGLGSSATSITYAIRSMEEAAAFLRHPVLGARLIELTTIVLTHKDKSIRDIFGSPDDLKFRSCMTLFSKVKGADPIFSQALEVFFHGIGDAETMNIISSDFPKFS